MVWLILSVTDPSHPWNEKLTWHSSPTLNMRLALDPIFWLSSDQKINRDIDNHYWVTTSPILDPEVPRRNLAGDVPPLPDVCLFRAAFLLLAMIMFEWKRTKAYLWDPSEERMVGVEVSGVELCLRVSGRLLAGTVIVWTDPSGVSISIWISSVTVWSTACSSTVSMLPWTPLSSDWLSTSTCTVSPFSSWPRIAITWLCWSLPCWAALSAMSLSKQM